MKKFITLFRIELKLNIRDFSGVLFGVIIPIGLMFLLGTLYKDASRIQESVPAVITIGICATGLMGIPITLSSYREKKLLRRFQVTPTSPLLLLMVQFAANFVTALISSVGVIILAVLMFEYKLEGNIISFLILYVLILFSIYSLGILIASISKSVSMSNLLCSLIYFPMFFLSGATVPFEFMPKGLQVVAQVMPLTHGIKILKGISLGHSMKDYFLPITILLLLGVLCMIVSVMTFKYDYE